MFHNVLFPIIGRNEPISFVELSKLTQSKTDKNFPQRLIQLYSRLYRTGNDEQNEPSDFDPFEALAEWKNGTYSECLHEHLFESMREEGLGNEVGEMEGN